MKLQRVAGYASLFFVAYRLFKKITDGQVRVKTMVIEKAFLEKLLKQTNFQTLLFNQEYDNKILAKDQVSLVGYVSDTDKNNTRFSIGTIGKGEPFTNELDYSVYHLIKDDIEEILRFYSGAAGLFYFLLEPIPFDANPKYLAYKITPANKSKEPIAFHKKAHKLQFAMAMNVINDATAAEDLEDDLSEDRGGGFSYLVVNPSPPANSNIEES